MTKEKKMKNFVILFVIVIMAGCEGRTVATAETDTPNVVNVTCPEIPEQDDGTLLACLDDLDEALDRCDEEPAPVPEPIVLIVCQANNALVENASDCPRVNLVCPRGTTASVDTAGSEFRCDEQNVESAYREDTPQGDLILPGTGARPVALFNVTNRGSDPVMPNGVRLDNVAQQAALATEFKVSVIRDNGEEETACVGQINASFPDSGCLYPLSDTTLAPNESVQVMVRIVTDGISAWPDNDRYVQMRLKAPNQDDVYGNWFRLMNSELTVSLASGSPSGAGVPGLSEVGRENFAANSRGDVFVYELTYVADATDNAGTGWTDGLMNPTRWEVYDADEPSAKLDADAGWSFQTRMDGKVEAVLNFNYSQNGVLLVAHGSTLTLITRTDTTGASSVANDTFRLILENVQWHDGRMSGSGFQTNNLPVAAEEPIEF